MLRDLDERPSTRETKPSRSCSTARSSTPASPARTRCSPALDQLGIELTDEQREQVATATYSGWVWTTGNFERMFSSPDMFRILLNTAFYVALVLVLFNTTYAMFWRSRPTTCPRRPPASSARCWLLPRITPPVIYVLMWKWLAWDTGFISMLLAPFGVPPKNWMLDSSANAWVFVILINGFVGASMGMLVFSSALKAIPTEPVLGLARSTAPPLAADPLHHPAADALADPLRHLLPDAEPAWPRST